MGAVGHEARREPKLLAMLAVAVCGAACSSADHPARLVVGTGAFTASENPCGRSMRPPVPGQILDLFSRGALDRLRFEDGHVFTAAGDTWSLWTFEDRFEVAEGSRAHVPLADGGYTIGFADLAGSLLVTETTPDVFEVRAAYDGSVTTTIYSEGTAQVGLAPDGSYLWTATSTVLSAWAPNGTLMVVQPGDYSRAKIAAVPGELHVADGPAGADRLEVVDTVLGQDHVSDPLPGVTDVMFWFADGDRVYTTDGVSQEWVFDARGGALATGKSLFLTGGYGDYMWRAQAAGPVDVFSVSRGLTQVATFNACDKPAIDRGRLVFPAPAASSIAGCGDDSVMGTVNLHGPVVQIDLPVLAGTWVPLVAFSDDASAYVWSPGNGAVRSSKGGALGCGYLRAIAGADDGTVALATDVGVVIATATADGGRGVGMFDVSASQVDISGDGRTVAAAAPGVAWTFSVPSTSLLHTWGKPTILAAGNDADVVRGFSMARSGARVAVSFIKSGSPPSANPEYEIRLSDPGASGQVSTLPAADPAVLLSPTGAFLITSDQPGRLVIDEGTKLRATVPNVPTAWWDERVYVARSSDGAGGWLPPEARDVDGGLVPGVTIASENVDGRGANNVQVLGVSYFPPIIPYANGLNYSQPAHQVLDRATGAVVIDAPSGIIAGPVVITQTATALVGRPLP